MKCLLLVVRLCLAALLFCLVLKPGAALAQQKMSTVKGFVRGETNQPLTDVSVVIRNTSTNFTTGSVTDSSGIFTATLPPGGPYAFTFKSIGYEAQTLSGYQLKEGTVFNMDIALKSAAGALEQVVVVGYGTQRKADVTGAIASVNSTSIARAAAPNPVGALQGQVPGVVISRNVAKPGGSFNINIRGVSSIGGSSAPLLVIDGIPSSSGLNDLNPADIDKIDILKDASATAIYGSRGAKGVVIVTTKRGKPGKTLISYDAYMGSKRPTHLPEMMNGPEYVAFRTEMFKAQGRSIDRSNTAFFTADQWQNIDAGRFTNWPDVILSNGLQMSHNISASGGDDKTRFSLGAGLLQEDGNVKPESFKRYTLRGNIDRQINQKWKAGISFYLAQNLQELGSSEALRSAYRLPPVALPFDSTGARVFRVYGSDAVTNPMFDQENEIRRNRNFRTFGNIYVQVEPVEHLVLKSTIAPSYSAVRSGSYFGPLTKERLGGAMPTQASNTTSEQFTWVLDNQAVYDTRINKHKITGTLVHSVQKDRLESNNITAEGLPYNSLWFNLATAPKVLSYGSGYTKYTLVSGMARVNYSFDDRYLLTATGRWDGSSRLAEGNQWGFFPSASLAWRVSQENFMQHVDAVSDMKLRLSYGVTGNDRVDAYSTQATLGQTYYDFGGVLAPGYAPSQLPNKSLTWETTREVNLGLDFALFKGRITGSVDVYDRKINNILLNRLLPAPSGWNSITDNIGKLQNSGIEIGLSTLNVKAGKFSWRSDFVFDRNRNKILELSGGKKDDIGNALFIGQPAQVNYDYVFDGIWQESDKDLAAKYNQKPGQIRVKDRDTNGIINASDRAIIGKRVPTWTGSWGNTFRYGNFDLYVLVYTRQGEQFTSSFDATFMNYNSAYNQVKIDYWTPERPSNTQFQPGNPGPYAGVINYRNINFTRVGNITLGYTLPPKLLEKFGLNGFRVYATATNPFIFTSYQGFDPEWANQNTYGTTVAAATYLLGVNVSF